MFTKVLCQALPRECMEWGLIPHPPRLLTYSKSQTLYSTYQPVLKQQKMNIFLLP